MQHTPRHLYDATIHKFLCFVLLRPIRGRRLLIKCHDPSNTASMPWNELPAIIRLKCLDLVLQLRLYKRFELLKLLKANSFGFQYL
jgi:hypothetical protein